MLVATWRCWWRPTCCGERRETSYMATLCTSYIASSRTSCMATCSKSKAVVAPSSSRACASACRSTWAERWRRWRRWRWRWSRRRWWWWWRWSWSWSWSGAGAGGGGGGHLSQAAQRLRRQRGEEGWLERRAMRARDSLPERGERRLVHRLPLFLERGVGTPALC